MSYIKDFNAELTKMLNSNTDTDTIVRFVSEKVLESYKNGITAGKNGTDVIRKGKSRPMGTRPPQAR